MARRTTKELAFSAIRIEGGLLAVGFLDKVAHLEASEQSEPDYDVPKGLKLRDEIGRYWKIAQNLWADFQAGRARTDLDAHAFTVREFLEPFCRQVLGFGDLQAVGQVTLQERVFPIGFQAVGGQVPLVFAAHTLGLEESDPRYGDNNAENHGEHHRRRSPFLMLQEYLNVNETTQWAIVSNGLRLRVLRDNPSLTRPAYVEVDLEGVFNEDLYPDFTALWLLAHASRFGKSAEPSSGCALERWRNQSQEAGIAARDRLRYGVADALRALGTGFVSHPENTVLRARLERSELTTQALYEQLLRLIYRLIFLATVEDRRDERTDAALVFAPNAGEAERVRYLEGYSLTRLREHAGKRRHYDRHGDLWQALNISFEGLRTGQPALGLPALGGIFSADRCPDLDTAQLENRHLLAAVFSLCFMRDGIALSRVDYRNIKTEEFGSIYESLLELVPMVENTSRSLTFVGDNHAEEGSAKGNARKLTGSYYTPDSLVQELIKSALDPVIEQTLKDNPQEPVKALLTLSVCDPACGSGHFLLAAARRLAETVAKLRAVDGNPTQDDYRHALRQVVGHCIFGVDKNPMAVELAHTALWLEAYTPDAPLTFLEHHIRCGDALLGVLDPKILEDGIPEEAFEVLSGDDKEVARRLKVENRAALKALKKLKSSDLFGLPAQTAAAENVEALPDDTLEALEAKRARWCEQAQAARSSAAMRLADTYVAAFLMRKTTEHEASIPLSGYFWNLAQGVANDKAKNNTAAGICRAHQVFHWWLEFPHIHARGGFSVLLGNPPWEVSQLGEEEFFSARAPSVAALPGEKRKRAIAALEVEHPTLWADYVTVKHDFEAINTFFRASTRFPLTAIGKLNTYSLFAETFAQLAAPQGRAGFIVPTGIATDDSTKAYFEAVTQTGRLVSLYDFRTGPGLFSAIGHQRFKFCLVTLGRTKHADFLFFALDVSHLSDARRHFQLTPGEFHLINPNTLTCPTFRSQQDTELTKKLYRAAPILTEDGEPGRNPWGIHFSQGLFNMTSDSGLFKEDAGPSRLPLYEAKMVHQFDHRWATYDAKGEDSRDVTESEKRDPLFVPRPRYWVEERQVLARIANVPRKLANAWLDDNDKDLLEELGLWLAGYLMNTAGLARVQDELARISTTLAAAARESKKWKRAAEDAADCPLTDDMLKQLGVAGSENALLELVDNWMDTRSPRWLMGWRNIARSTDERSFISSIVPRSGVGHSMPLWTLKTAPNLSAGFLANMTAITFDYVVRQKLGGTNMTFGYYKQIPVIPPERYTESDLTFIVPRVLELTYTAHDLRPWAEDLGHNGPPFEWNPDRRALLRADIDAYYARLYGLTRDELRYILDPVGVMGDDYPSETFRVLKNNEYRAFGEYRTQRLVLEAWDRLQGGS